MERDKEFLIICQARKPVVIDQYLFVARFCLLLVTYTTRLLTHRLQVPFGTGFLNRYPESSSLWYRIN